MLSEYTRKTILVTGFFIPTNLLLELQASIQYDKPRKIFDS